MHFTLCYLLDLQNYILSKVSVWLLAVLMVAMPKNWCRSLHLHEFTAFYLEVAINCIFSRTDSLNEYSKISIAPPASYAKQHFLKNILRLLRHTDCKKLKTMKGKKYPAISSKKHINSDRFVLLHLSAP